MSNQIVHLFPGYFGIISTYTIMQVKSVNLVRIIIISWRFKPLLCVFQLQQIPTMHISFRIKYTFVSFTCFYLLIKTTHSGCLCFSQNAYILTKIHPNISKRSRAIKKKFPLPHVRILYSTRVVYKILYPTGEIKRLSNEKHLTCME